jgi:murein DD-endopeptidase MepM/ murein hydrolase activator NlpD
LRYPSALALPLLLTLTAAAPPGAPTLVFPVACQTGKDCEIQHYVDRDPGPAVKDYRCGRHTYEGHKGTDIRLLDMAAMRRGVDVLAAAPGRVVRLRDGEPDISVKAPGAPSVKDKECGNGVVVDHGGGWETQYCHLARGSLRVKQGDVVAAGQSIARVGLSGATEMPHLHLQVSRGGQIVDPFAAGGAGACGAPVAAQGLWTPAALGQLAYKDGAILNIGFAGGAFDMVALEDARLPPASATSGYLVGYGRAIGLKGGDVVEVSLLSPNGAVLARNASPPLERDKAQYLNFAGKKRPAAGWPPGSYVVEMRVLRAGTVALRDRRSLRL